MALEKRVSKLEKSLMPNGEHTYCRDDWTFAEHWLYLSEDCPPELKEKAAKTDWNESRHPQRKLEDYF